MKINSTIINKNLTVEEAYDNLEKAVHSFIVKAEWYTPYAGINIKLKSKINQLRLPLIELRIAKKNKNKK